MIAEEIQNWSKEQSKTYLLTKPYATKRESLEPATLETLSLCTAEMQKQHKPLNKITDQILQTFLDIASYKTSSLQQENKTQNHRNKTMV